MQGKYRALWLDEDDNLEVIDQTKLPFEYETKILTNAAESILSIKDMTVRGAGVIGNVAAFGVYLAAREVGGDLVMLEALARQIRDSRPTAVNLMWAVDRMLAVIDKSGQIIEDAKAEAIALGWEPDSDLKSPT